MAKLMTDEFTRHILGNIIAKVAKELGFTTVTESVLSILTDVVIDRVNKIGQRASAISAHGGRTDTHGMDLFNALYMFNETPESLARFVNSTSFPSFDFLVDPYPIPIQPNFYEDRMQNTANNTPIENKPMFPFRSYLKPKCNDMASSHIPEFYPKMPESYTLQYIPNANNENSGGASNKDDSTFDEDQSKLKIALSSLLSKTMVEDDQQVMIDNNLIGLINDQIIAKPSPIIQQNVVLIDSNRPTMDPENIVISIKEDSEEGRDVKSYIRMLTTQHKSDAIGKTVNKN